MQSPEVALSRSEFRIEFEEVAETARRILEYDGSVLDDDSRDALNLVDKIEHSREGNGILENQSSLVTQLVCGIRDGVKTRTSERLLELGEGLKFYGGVGVLVEQSGQKMKILLHGIEVGEDGEPILVDDQGNKYGYEQYQELLLPKTGSDEI